MYTRKKNISIVEIMCLSAVLSNNFILTSAQIDEGNPCTMVDGRAGICTMHYSCDFWKAKMQNRDFPRGSDLCSIKDRDPVVCCPEQQPTTTMPDHEGNQCTMDDGRAGICSMHYDCDYWVTKMRNGQFPWGPNLCRLEGRDPVVCCPEKTPTDEPIIYPDEDDSPSEGKACTMETDGGPGVCTPLRNCAPRVQDVMQGKRLDTSAGHCSFDGYIEIVCCPLTSPPPPPTTNVPQIRVRPSLRVCQEHEARVSGIAGTDVINTNIIDGQIAAAGDFPFMAALGYRNDPEDPSNISYICGGSLITDRHVLTAAHCASNVNNYRPVEVRLGSVNLRVEDQDTQRIPISRIEIHPNHRPSVSYFDIAVVVMSRPATFAINKTMPICLQNVPYTNLAFGIQQEMIVSGWGVTDFNSVTPSDELRYTRSLTFIDRQTCAVQYQDSSKLPQGLDDSLLCVLDTNAVNRSDACQGDSGGPLLLRGQYVHTLVGIVSFGQSCASSVPSIYTSIFTYLDWIEEKVWPNEIRSSG